MSHYPTGEMAQLCAVSVRTVQYYDSRGILIPGTLSEGGRRLYSEEDLRRLRIICFLRDAGLSIGSIGELLADEDPGSVIAVLLDQQETLLREEISDGQNKLTLVEQIRRELKNTDHFTVESIGDIAYVMENRRRMYRIRATMLIAGLIGELIELATLLYGICTHIWWPYLAGLPVIIGIGVWLTLFYFRRVEYICPQCHTVFRPGFREAFFANHTPTTRKLTCPHCGRKGFCVETCGKEEKSYE
ncbi:MAG: MerR family transcriptional regulator [Clostridia bacterium]|nr:MerR family transcriptional regulator [Clostridia bacterium]